MDSSLIVFNICSRINLNIYLSVLIEGYKAQISRACFRYVLNLFQEFPPLWAFIVQQKINWQDNYSVFQSESVFKPIHPCMNWRKGSYPQQEATRGPNTEFQHTTLSYHSLPLVTKTKAWKTFVQQGSGWILSSPVRPHSSSPGSSLPPIYLKI